MIQVATETGGKAERPQGERAGEEASWARAPEPRGTPVHMGWTANTADTSGKWDIKKAEEG